MTEVINYLMKWVGEDRLFTITNTVFRNRPVLRITMVADGLRMEKDFTELELISANFDVLLESVKLMDSRLTPPLTK